MVKSTDILLVEVRLNGQVQVPSNYVVNGSSVASTYNLAGGEINHAEPSAPPISGDPLPSFEDLETPPPRYEDIYKTTTEWGTNNEGFF